MSQKTKIQLLVALLVVALAVFFYNRGASPALSGGVSADTQFRPLDVKDPVLQLDRLQKAQQDVYSGGRHNIFVAAAPPLPPAPPAPRPFVGPRLPPPPQPPPPLEVPVQFYGTETSANSRTKLAFFQNGDDPLIVREGETFLSRFRLVKINADSADVEEISTGRHATVPLVHEEQPSQSPSN